LRIRATGVAANWRGVFNGYSYYYAPGTQSSYNLGEGRLNFYYLPATASTPPDDPWGTGNWLDQMSNGGSGSGCSSSPAMQVACYMDQHGLHGNVVVLDRDSDGDNVDDWQDRYPQDKYRN
jgi:hypothetical protein